MDNKVIAAMARWPDVPDVFGWLSLDERGQWRVHPQGNALLDPSSLGDSISSPQILQFINRNYACDAHGQWYFQNGPQRVYVRLDAAPFVFHSTETASLGAPPALRSHSGLDAGEVSEWRLDDRGRLYAQARLGPGLIAGRDLEAVLRDLRTSHGQSVLDALHDGSVPLHLKGGAVLIDDTFTTIAANMGFVRLPSAE